MSCSKTMNYWRKRIRWLKMNCSKTKSCWKTMRSCSRKMRNHPMIRSDLENFLRRRREKRYRESCRFVRT